MFSALIYDFRRTVTSRSLLVSFATVVALSLALIPVIRAAQAPISSVSPNNALALGYSTNDGYHFLVYSFNTYGQPTGGSNFSAQIKGVSGAQAGSGTTNSSGYSSFFVASPPSETFQISFNLTYGKGFSQGGIIEHNAPLLPGSVHSFGEAQFAPVVDSSNSSKIDILVFDETPGGAPPEGYGVYYSFSNSSATGSRSSVNSTNGMSLLGTLHSYHQMFSLPAIPAGTQSVNLALSAPDGSQFQGATLPVSDFGVKIISVQPKQIFRDYAAGIFSLVVPLMAILVAYGSYGKDRTTGVLESVLARPVSRLGLGVSRYLSMLTALAVAIGLSVGVMEIISRVMIGSFLGWDYAVATYASLVIEAAAFIGITMLLSHVIRSSGALIGASVVLWVLLDFFWGIMIFAVSNALGYGIHSANYTTISVQSNFFNPAQFYLLVADFLNGQTISVTGGSNIPISPEAYGLTPLTITAAGIIWVVIPFLLFLRLSVKRD